MKRALIITVLLIILYSVSSAQGKKVKPSLYPIEITVPEGWELTENSDYKIVEVVNKEWGPLKIVKVGKGKFDTAFAVIKKTYYLDSTGKILKHLDFSEGRTTINGKVAKYMVAVFREGNATNGLWTDLRYFIKKTDTDFYYIWAEIRGDAKDLFLSVINSIKIL